MALEAGDKSVATIKRLSMVYTPPFLPIVAIKDCSDAPVQEPAGQDLGLRIGYTFEVHER